ncbi:uncharacterized protein LOC144451169 [Glandiceps talaboti]
MDDSDKDPITFADLGVPTTQTTSDTYFGKRRNYSDLDTKEIVFLTVSLLSILATIGLTIERIITVDKNHADFTFAILILINAVFILYYTLDGVFRERAFELAAFVIAVGIIIVYCITNYIGTFDEDKINVVKLSRLVLIGALGPIDIGLGIVLTIQYYKSRNLIFRTVGANTEMQDMCSLMFFFEAVLKFDLQLQISIVVLILSTTGVTVTTIEISILVIGLIYCCIWVIVGYFAVRRESKPLAWIFLITSILEPVYLVYKMIDLGNNWSNFTKHDAMYLAIITIICAVFALVVRVVAVITMVKVYKNFGKGLKEVAYGNNNGSTRLDKEDHRPTTYGSTDTDKE